MSRSFLRAKKAHQGSAAGATGVDGDGRTLREILLEDQKEFLEELVSKADGFPRVFGYLSAMFWPGAPQSPGAKRTLAASTIQANGDEVDFETHRQLDAYLSCNKGCMPRTARIRAWLLDRHHWWCYDPKVHDPGSAERKDHAPEPVCPFSDPTSTYSFPSSNELDGYASWGVILIEAAKEIEG